MGDVEMHGTSTIAKENLLEGATKIQSHRCQIRSLDDTIIEPVGFIKIDVEGHELEVLQGSVGILEKDRPVLLIESEHRHHSGAPKNIFEFMSGYGYAGLFLEDDKLRSISAFNMKFHQNPAAMADGVRKIGLYVNNFIFVPG
jgi:hypothetical protein